MTTRNLLFTLLIYSVFYRTLLGIIIPANQFITKPPYSSGIKSETWRQNNDQLTMHHNYSRVIHQNSQTRGSTETHGDNQRYYPVYKETGKARTFKKLVRENTSGRHGSIYKVKKEIAQPHKAYNECPEGATGSFVHYASCNQFLNCWKGHGVVQTCAPGTLFNPRSLECDYPAKVICSTGESQLAPYRVQRNVAQTGCPPDFVGLIPDYTDCAKFINCNHGISYKQDCPPGTLFDMSINMCNHAHLSVCFNGQNGRDDRDLNPGEDYDYETGARETYSSGSGTRGSYGGDSRFHNGYVNSYRENEGRGSDYNQVEVDRGQGNGNHQVQSNFNRGQSYGSHQVASNLNRVDVNSGQGYGNHRVQSNFNRGQSYGNHRVDSDVSGSQSYGSQQAGSNLNRVDVNGGKGYEHHWVQSTLDGDEANEGQGYGNHRVQSNYNRGQGYGNHRVDSDTNGSQNYGNHRVVVTEDQSYANRRIQSNLNRVDVNGGQSYGNRRVIGSGAGAGAGATQTRVNQNGHRSNENGYYRQEITRGQYIDSNRLEEDEENENYLTSNSNNYHQQQSSKTTCPESTGLFRHPTDCSKFLNCFNGHHVVQDCPSGLRFNEATKVCDWPRNVPCNDDTSRNTSPRPSTTTQRIARRTSFGTTPSYSSIGRSTTRLPPLFRPTNPDSPSTRTRTVTASYSQYERGSRTERLRINDHLDWEESARNSFATTARITINSRFNDDFEENEKSVWPPPFPKSSPDYEYYYEYEDGSSVEIPAENEKPSFGHHGTGERCREDDFKCDESRCVPKTQVCNGLKECLDGKDEENCEDLAETFIIYEDSHLMVLERERWNNVSYKTCALLCIEAKFSCRSFNFRKADNVCFLSDENIGTTGAPIQYVADDYYELKSASIDCSSGFTCTNQKCVNASQKCDGADDCGDRSDEKNCRADEIGYRVRLAGSTKPNEGRIEITAFGSTGYICDDSFGINEAQIVCTELGFQLGAAEVKKNSYYAKEVSDTDVLYLMDDVKCRGNETSLRDCDFNGWGVHNCLEEEIVGVVCKTQQEKCPENFWQCRSGNECIPLPFLCDGLSDCTDESDESDMTCLGKTEVRLVNGSSANQGRVEVKHNGVWGTVCDDDFNENAARVICRSLGYNGSASVVRNEHYGQGKGVIWLDQVYCNGSEPDIESCIHWAWGEHNCEHSEDVGVTCSEIYVPSDERHGNKPVIDTSEFIYPETCGYTSENLFVNGEVQQRVINGSLAKPGRFPWQAALKIKATPTISTHWCGAIIISPTFLLTAAHCLSGYPKGAYVVVAGDYNTNVEEGTEQRAAIEEFYLHHEFRQGHRMNNDIALIRIKGTGFRLDGAVNAVCLTDRGHYERERDCVISGFGSVRSGSAAYSHEMLAGWIPMQSHDTCRMPHVYGDHMTENMFCAGSLDGGVDACDGDSGGPLVCLDDGVFTLYGITSWGQHCGYANRPGVYVKVANYKKWIDDKIKESLASVI